MPAVTAKLSLLIAASDGPQAKAIAASLSAATTHKIVALANLSNLAETVSQTCPDVVVIALAAPKKFDITTLAQASGAYDRAVVLCAEHADEALSTAAINAGVSAFIVGGLPTDRLAPVLTTASARFRMTRQMRRDLAQATQALKDRKTLDRAKGILMRARTLSEDDAYALLRKTAMDQGKKLTEVAQALVTASDLLG